MRDPKNEGLNNRLFETIIKLNRECPFHNFMGIYITELRPGEAVLELAINENHINPREIAHGGVAFSLADTAMGFAIRTLNYHGATIEMNINYIKAAGKSDILKATGRVVDIGSRFSVVQAQVVNQEGEKIAVSRSTFYNLGKLVQDLPCSPAIYDI